MVKIEVSVGGVRLVIFSSDGHIVFVIRFFGVSFYASYRLSLVFFICFSSQARVMVKLFV